MVDVDALPLQKVCGVRTLSSGRISDALNIM